MHYWLIWGNNAGGLSGSQNDAWTMHHALRGVHQLLVGPQSREAIVGWIRSTVQRADSGKDTVGMYYSGHGYRMSAERGAPVEADGLDEYLPCTDGPLRDHDLMAAFGSFPRKVLILDCCHAGGFDDLVVVDPGSWFVIASCRESESAMESWDRASCGVFTYHMVQALHQHRAWSDIASSFDQNDCVALMQLMDQHYQTHGRLNVTF